MKFIWNPHIFRNVIRKSCRLIGAAYGTVYRAAYGAVTRVMSVNVYQWNVYVIHIYCVKLDGNDTDLLVWHTKRLRSSLEG